MLSASRALWAALHLVALTHVAVAVIPTGRIDFRSVGGSVYCEPADFGPDLPSSSRSQNLLLVKPIGLQDGCEPEVEVTTAKGAEGFALFVSRGNCSFEKKALAAQQVGASAIIIYNSLPGIYNNKTAAVAKQDYECSRGQGWLEEVVEPLWDDSNRVPECEAISTCTSKHCLVTDTTDAKTGYTKVCCAWDLYIPMGIDSSVPLSSQPKIPSVYLTMEAGATVEKAIDASNGELVAAVYNRPRPKINVSSFLIWAMGVCTVVFASWFAARGEKLKAEGSEQISAENQVEEPLDQEQAVDLSVGHTVGFIVMASTFLILLFYVNLNAFINVLYTISSASAISAILFRPLLAKSFPSHVMHRIIFSSNRLGIDLSILDVSSTVAGFAVSIWWYMVRRTASYAFVLQDLLGICLCILFLTLVRFPNIRVATVLLTLAFFYDIFFVFISPYFFGGESVMVKVATGGQPIADPIYCEKYPNDKDCKTREQLPMLLLLPRIGDYLGGDTMLGLGDIILPGLLVAFTARYDRSLGVPLHRGYFRFMVWGYAVGLMMANMAVYLMQMGQPALLYLVPCTLGFLSALAYRDGTLKQLWDGPPSLSSKPATQMRAVSDSIDTPPPESRPAAPSIVLEPGQIVRVGGTEDEPLLNL